MKRLISISQNEKMVNLFYLEGETKEDILKEFSAMSADFITYIKCEDPIEDIEITEEHCLVKTNNNTYEYTLLNYIEDIERYNPKSNTLPIPFHISGTANIDAFMKWISDLK